MRFEILYLIDQQASHRMSVVLDDAGPQPIVINDGKDSIELSYVQAACVAKALVDVTKKMQETNRVPSPNAQYPGYCLEYSYVDDRGNSYILDEWEY